MSEILKTEAIVLKKIEFGETSRIAHFYTRDLGRISGIIKGAKSPKSKYGKTVDILNHLNIVLYNKHTREIQLISDIDLINHFRKTKDNYDKLKYALAVVELISALTVEHDPNKRLFEGTIKILKLIENGPEDESVLFLRYMLFFIKEIGYEFQLEECSICNRKILEGESISYIYDQGIVCAECRQDRITNVELNSELFNFLLCLSQKKIVSNISQIDISRLINILERFLINNVREFKGLNSLKM
jgi:DNA repair protein RecO (recombination protein O)